MKINAKTWMAGVLPLAMVFLLPLPVGAHCDTLDGPVVAAARRALESGNVNAVLYWVDATRETEVRDAFEQTRAVRILGVRPQALADRYFFETVVRLHRAGEGEPYTGLKPAGLDSGPAITAADRSLIDRTSAAVFRLLTTTIEAALQARFEAVLRAKDFKADDLDAGRQFVRAYVEYLHYVEAMYETGKAASGGSLHETVK